MNWYKCNTTGSLINLDTVTIIHSPTQSARDTWIISADTLRDNDVYLFTGSSSECSQEMDYLSERLLPLRRIKE